MDRVIAYLVRFAVIILGYAVASLAGSAFLNIVFLATAGFTAEQTPAVATGSLIFSIPFVALFVAYFAFIPSVPAILLSEILGKRDWLYYAVAGGIVAFVVLGLFWHAGNEMYAVSEALDPDAGATDTRSSMADPGVVLLMVASGMFAGIGYWLVAGRTAGSWRGRPDATSPAP